MQEQWESGEETIDEEGKNPTQRRLDDEAEPEAPADASRRGEEWGETEDSPHEGEEGQLPA
jgi:hypothetical protein